jgi:hypothetical protein
LPKRLQNSSTVSVPCTFVTIVWTGRSTIRAHADGGREVVHDVALVDELVDDGLGSTDSNDEV